VAVNHPWLQVALTYATGVGLFILLAFFIGPISVLVAGLFLDDLADVVEADLYAPDARGHAIPASQAILMGVRFAALSAGVNLLALFLQLVPGLNAIAFILANATVSCGPFHRFLRRDARPECADAVVRRRLHVAGL
jgi:CysZ protein